MNRLILLLFSCCASAFGIAGLLLSLLLCDNDSAISHLRRKSIYERIVSIGEPKTIEGRYLRGSNYLLLALSKDRNISESQRKSFAINAYNDFSQVKYYAPNYKNVSKYMSGFNVDALK